MYFTDTPSLNSMEAMMRKTPHTTQRGGGRNRSPYRYTKKDCDCRLCLYYRKKEGCTASVCPVLDIRLKCGAASFYEAVQSTFREVKHIRFQRRLHNQYQKDGGLMIYQNALHKKIFETERTKLRKLDSKTLAVLYLLTANRTLWTKSKHHLSANGKVDLKNVHLGDISIDGYALWKAVKEIQAGERQITLCELSDSDVISDKAFRLIVQAVTVARFGSAVLTGGTENA